MNINKIDAKGESCSFCRSEKLKDFSDLVKHYQTVYEISGAGIKVRICPDCVNELITSVSLTT